MSKGCSKYPNISNAIAQQLQERLIQCCIDYVKETGNKEIDEVIFNVSELQESVQKDTWIASSDSYCEINGWHKEFGKYKISVSY